MDRGRRCQAAGLDPNPRIALSLVIVPLKRDPEKKIAAA
jgi:hypothetical protein